MIVRFACTFFASPHKDAVRDDTLRACTDMAHRSEIVAILRRFLLLAAVLVTIGVPAALATRLSKDSAVRLVGLTLNYFASLWSPSGMTRTELAGDAAAAPWRAPTSISTQPSEEWPSYNRTLTSERYSLLSEINIETVHALKVLCTYDTKQYASFQAGLLMVDGALIGTTEHDIFSIDAANCGVNWRTSEDYKPASLSAANRGAAYLDGYLFRGTQDGRVLAYDFKTGRRQWETTIANPDAGETVPAAPIAWNGLVFVGNAGGENKGVKGRMYALDARTGQIVWEAYLVPKTAGDLTRGPAAPPLPATAAATWQNKAGVPITGGATWTSSTIDPASGLLYVPGGDPGPTFAIGVREGENLYAGSMVVLDAKTGAYHNHYKIVPRDWHDWDVSAAPAIIQTRGGRKLLSIAPKDGHLYGFDLLTDKLIYRTAVTRIENTDAPFSADTPTRFCPGSQGGAEWNGPAYDPRTNLVLVGEVDWCNSVTLQKEEKILSTRLGRRWTGNASLNPFHVYGTRDPRADWAGWLYAIDADTGAWTWRLKSNYPIVSGVTPTAGGIVLFGDMGGNLYVVDAASGRKLWSRNIGGAIGGGVITYTASGAQKVAIAAGMTSIIWPTPPVTAKVVILGLGNVSAREGVAASHKFRAQNLGSR